MSEFHLKFNLQPYEELDQFALLVCQKYNYGNENDWFGAFRGGLYGSYARIHGVVSHYHAIHSWLPRPRFPSETEYQLASIFFNMDSSIECIAFALNALGFCAARNSFRDVTSSKELKRVSPFDLVGQEKRNPPREPLSGYAEVFPSVQELWKGNRGVLDMIFEQHDVSKHRESIFSGGMCRNDPPPGFFELLGVDDDSSRRALFWPMKEIILKSEPKTPHSKRVPQPRESYMLLEELVPQFQELILETGMRVLTDVKQNIALKVGQLEKASPYAQHRPR